jgi:hypothetical protein
VWQQLEAFQGEWDKVSIVYGCPIKNVMAVLEKRLQAHQADQQKAAGNDSHSEDPDSIANWWPPR